MSLRLERELFLALLLLLSTAPALKALRDPIRPETFAHLRVGTWVLENDRVPTTDLFTGDGRHPHPATSWAFDAALAWSYQLGEYAGVVGFRLLEELILAVTLFQFVLRRTGDGLRPLAMLAAACVALMPLSADGPGSLSVAFCVWTMSAVCEVRDGESPLKFAWLPGLFAVWANIDLQFLLGLLVLAIACIAPLLDAVATRTFPRFMGGESTESGRPVFRVPLSLLLLTLACAGSALFNPHRTKVYSEAFDALVSPATRLTAELTPPDPRELSTWAGLVLWSGACFLLGRRGGRLSTFDVLLMAGGAYLALTARRDLWVAVLAALAVLARPRLPDAEADRVPLWRTALLTTAAFLLVGLGLGVGLRQAWRPGEELARHYPVRAVESLRAEKPEFVFSDPEWGGYLMWALPGTRVAVDSRVTTHGAERLRQLTALWNTPPPDWNDDPDLRAARIVVANRHRPLTGWLLQDDAYRADRPDGVAIVLRRAE